jgi:predicted phage terminase large subunit-like protein
MLNVLRKRLTYPELKRTVREHAEAHKASVIVIEDKSSGTALIQDLIADGFNNIKRYEPHFNKEMRMYEQALAIENGFVYLPQQAHWLGEYLLEITTFPKSRYKDQVDSTSQALDWIKQATSSVHTSFLRVVQQKLTSLSPLDRLEHDQKISARVARLREILKQKPNPVSEAYIKGLESTLSSRIRRQS